MPRQEQVISVVACRGGGKTTLLAALKAACPKADAAGMTLEFPHAGTQVYLRRIVESLLAGEFPAATFQDLTRIEMDATLDSVPDQRFKLVFHDFKGDLLDAEVHVPDRKWRRAVERSLHECDTLLLLLDPTESRQATFDALDSLFSSLESNPTRRGVRDRTVVVLLTKADTLFAGPEELAAAQAALDALLRGEHVPDGAIPACVRDNEYFWRLFRQLCDKETVARCRIFFTTAVGFDFVPKDPTQPPRLEPVNLFEPLAWAIEEGLVLRHQLREEIMAHAVWSLVRRVLYFPSWFSGRLGREVTVAEAIIGVLVGLVALIPLAGLVVAVWKHLSPVRS